MKDIIGKEIHMTPFAVHRAKGRKSVFDQLREIEAAGVLVIPEWLHQFIKENTPDEKEAK